jgi:SAM-dependent methyltransferase
LGISLSVGQNRQSPGQGYGLVKTDITATPDNVLTLLLTKNFSKLELGFSFLFLTNLWYALSKSAFGGGEHLNFPADCLTIKRNSPSVFGRLFIRVVTILLSIFEVMGNNIVKRILQQNRDLYNGVSKDFSSTRNYIWPGLDRFTKMVNDDGRVLDLGCGNGRLANLFKDRRVKYLGVDFSENLIKVAQDNFKGVGNVKFEVGDLLTYKSKDKFDLILAIASLHHIPTKKEQLRVLKNIFHNLNNDGVVVLTNWNLLQAKWRPYLFKRSKEFGCGIFNWRDAFIPWKSDPNKEQFRFVHSFGKNELKRMLKSVGFKIKEIYFEANGKEAGVFDGKNLVVVAYKK